MTDDQSIVQASFTVTDKHTRQAPLAGVFAGVGDALAAKLDSI